MSLRTMITGNMRTKAGRSWGLIIILPFILCLILFFAVRTVIYQQIQDHAQQTAIQFSLQSSAMLQEMKMFGQNLTENVTFVNMMSVEAADVYDPLKACTFIKDAVAQSTYVRHVYAVNERQGKIYSDEGYFNIKSLDVILTKLGVDTDGISDASGGQLENYNGIAPYYFARLRSADDQEEIGTVIVSLSMTEFLENFYTLDASLCCVFNEDMYISSAPARNENINWTDEAQISALLGEKVTCVYKGAEDYTYLVAISNSEYNQPLKVILLCFGLYALTIFAIQAASVCQSNRRWKHQVNTLVEILPEYEGDVSYPVVVSQIRDALQDYEAQKITKQQQEQERNLRYMLYGHNPKIISDAFITSSGLPMPFQGYFCVAAFTFRRLGSGTPFAMQKREEGQELAAVVLVSVLKGLANSVEFTSCSDIDSLIAVFWGDHDETLKSSVQEICSSSAQLMLETYNISVQVTVSRCFRDIRQISVAFSQTRDLNEFSRSVDSQAEVTFYDTLTNTENNEEAVDFIRQQQILINTLLAQKYSIVPEMVSGILATSVSSLQKDFDLARGRFRNIANLLLEALLNAGAELCPPEEVLTRFRSVNNVAELNAVTKEYFSRLSEAVEERSRESELVQRASQYIRDNLDDHNLNVSAICETVGVSVQRLTRMFHSSYNTSIAEYMNILRIEKAKELLRKKPEINIANIAEAVGYNNTHSLARNFRKLEGLTPTEYRKLRLNK